MPKPTRLPDERQQQLLSEVRVQVAQRRQLPRLHKLLDQHHYLGSLKPVGERIYYLATDASGRWMAILVFSAAANHLRARDQWIGWSASQRVGHLGLVANNTRFLILPWIQVPQLASHILGQINRRIRLDWLAKYGQPVWLLETFVDQQRFSGTCYQAANWICLGQTKGRGRQGPCGSLSTTIKDIYVWPLHQNFRSHLTSVQTNPLYLPIP